MFYFIVSLLFSVLIPQHDFHTSWMNLTFNEKNNQFEVSWRTDTEHLEGVLTSFSGAEIKLESTSTEDHKVLLNKYINKNTSILFNQQKQLLEVDVVEVTFAEVVIHFKPINYKRKLKSVTVASTLLQMVFPNQKNMVQLNYKGKMYSMLLGGSKTIEEVFLD